MNAGIENSNTLNTYWQLPEHLHWEL